ncbi:MAG: polysaccharide lyase 6 family protein [Verrucomicrobiae bacterium]|nr:polysaccharide lyase 6 family protein [Verrucomicrobiae bacterium]
MRPGHFSSQLAGLAFLAGAAFGGRAAAVEVGVDAIEQALASATPGTVLEIPGGVYSNLELELEGHGTADAPIVVRAHAPGTVVFSGKSGIELKGAYVVLEGLWFRDGEAPEKTVIDLDGDHLRLTNTVISDFNPVDPESREDKWVALRGQFHQVDHCTFRNKTSKSVTLTVWRKPGEPDHDVIEYNHFHTRPRGAEGNGYETIRIGTSEESDSDSLTSVRHNLFEACDGEMEAVSVKAGRCVIEGNTFKKCAGTLSLRHGNGSRVTGNLFAGMNKKATGGLRVYGANHLVTGNLFIGLTGRGEAALAIQSGQETPKKSGYQPVENLLVEGNLFAANQGPAVKLDVEFGNDRRTVLPRAVVVRKNTFSATDLQGLISGGERVGLELTMDRNQVFAGNQIPKDITSKFPPPLTKADVGADWYRDQLP